jgi:Domain of unknown function (DUF5655)
MKRPGHECYHCKQWVDDGDAHDCWTTTEAALTRELPEDLQDAYERLRETAAEFGEQRIYASHKSIMFSRKSCYFFVRPRKTHLELCVFLGRPIRAPQVRRVEKPSKAKVANIIRVLHRDEVEAPITDWLREAYQFAQPDLKVRPTSETARDLKVRPTPETKPDLKGRPTEAGRVFRPAKTTTATRRSARARTRRGRAKGRAR